MLQKIYIKHLNDYIDQSVTLAGWVLRVRDNGKICFLQFRDGTGFIQVIASKEDVSTETFEIMRHLERESSVKIQGKVVKNPKSPSGLEIIAENVIPVSESKSYPITPKEHGTDFLMDLRHLWIRAPRQNAILKIRHQIVSAIRQYFDDLDFTLIDAPLFTANECEGSSTLFKTPYFGEEAYLSQSGQLYMEAACEAFGRAYCFGPTFRAENSNTRRHLTEFWMVEPEVAYMDLEGDMELAEGLVQAIVKRVLEKCKLELQILERDCAPLENVISGNFPRISYTEAVEIIQKSGVNFNWGDDFGGGDETIIGSAFNRPVIVYGYPKEIKPFYMKTDPENPKIVRNMDILAPEGYGEIIGGGQREEDYNTLIEAIKAQGLAESSYQWYTDLRKYGSVPHAGFGLGVERCVAWICGLPHVRETGAFPRLPRRLKP
ncbi:MAG: asparagine--tRNA ligase [Fibrobacteraceae bacterium]|nr:asparagine--tRNA ligase [Fibrobacteraceae bacterium]